MNHAYTGEESFKSHEKESARDFDRQARRARFLQQAREIKLTSRTAELMEILFEMHP